jgi:hypothetical protein
MDVDTHIPSEDLKVMGRSTYNPKCPQELPFLKDPKTCKLTSLETQNA